MKLDMSHLTDGDPLRASAPKFTSDEPPAEPKQPSRFDRFQAWMARTEAWTLQQSSDKNQKRADKMADKKMRGKRRMRAAQARADADRRKLDRLGK
jgi:hypothetical protein